MVARPAARSGSASSAPADRSGSVRRRVVRLDELYLPREGDLELLDVLLAGPAVCITGSRACTEYGRHVAGDLGRDLARSGGTLVTDGNFGITEAALRAALVDDGKVVLVSSGGLDRPYPPANAELHSLVQASKQGVRLSPFPPGTVTSRTGASAARHLVSALAGATVVIEAGRRSGCLAVAEALHASHRAVFAVPGPVTSAVSAGTAALIASGTAALITDLRDLGDPRGLTGPKVKVPAAAVHYLPE